MARIRDPARDKAKELFQNNKDITNREIANILGVDEKKIATWKIRDNWKCSTTEKKNVVQRNKKCSTTKLKKEKKALISNEDKDYEWLDEDKDYEWLDEEDGLTDKQRLFCYYYMESFNVFQSGIKAGYSPNYSRTRIYEMLENVSIKNFLNKLKEQQKSGFLLSQERILNRHSQIAFSDINDYINADGTLKENTDGTLIKKIIIKTSKSEIEGSYRENSTVSIELEDRKESLKFLTKYLGLEKNDKNDKNITSINEVRKKNGL